MNQSYDNYQLCIDANDSTSEEIRKVLEHYRNCPKIDIKYNESQLCVSECANIAIGMAKGEFIAFMDCGDILSENALSEVVKKLNEKDYDFVYSDEDKISCSGRRYMPHFKQEWCPDTLMSFMYTGHLGVYRTEIVKQTGGLREEYEGAQYYDFILRFTEITNRIGHISKVLYHCIEEANDIEKEIKTDSLKVIKRTKEDALRRRDIAGHLELIEDMNQYRIIYDIVGQPLVSVIIPTRDNFNVFKRCIESFIEKTAYKNVEFIVIDNGSLEDNRTKYDAFCRLRNISYTYRKMEFNFSRMCNIGAEIANGEYLLLLNDDIEIIDSNWLERMLGHAQLSYIGAVGAKLYYPDSKMIQHDGVIFFEPGPAHCLSKFNDDEIYYFGRNRLEYNYSAVTAACLLVSSKKYKEVGGMEETLAVAYNDVDFCVKLVEKGYYNVIRNDAVLYHHESLSRGNDVEDAKKLKRLKEERQKLYHYHTQLNNIDPCYSPNLIQTSSDFTYNVIYDTRLL